MNIFGKPLEQVTVADLQGLVEREAQEDLFLDYKEEPYKDDKQDKFAFLTDVTAFANAQGGLILIGITEEQSLPQKIVGIEGTEENLEEIKARYTNYCRDCIRERLDIHINAIKINSGKYVLAIQIPRSLRQPHMVIVKGNRTFYKRHNDHSDPMSIDEIRETVRMVDKMMDRSEKIITMANDEASNLAHPEQCFFHLSVLPTYIKDYALDPWNEDLIRHLQNPPIFDNTLTSISGKEARPFMHGIEWLRGRNNITSERLAIYHHGLIDYYRSSPNCHDEPNRYTVMPIRDFIERTINLILFAKTAYNLSQVHGPFLLSAHLYGNLPLLLQSELNFFDDDFDVLFEKNEAIVPPVRMPELYSEMACARILTLSVFRTFHRFKCHYFDEQGNYTKRM